jgi:predicted nuclease of predicted toxin-antitoxin system
MKFKIDENLPGELVADLRASGHDADTVSDQGLAGAAGAVILSRVQADARTLLTLDKGMADVRAYPPDQYAGIILFRPGTTGRSATLAFVRQHLPSLLQADLNGRLVVVSETGIRIR